jgi:tryptophan synthase beta subunit
VQSEAIAGTIPQYQQVVAGEFSEKIGEEHGDTRKAVLAIVGGGDLSRRLFGSMS